MNNPHYVAHGERAEDRAGMVDVRSSQPRRRLRGNSLAALLSAVARQMTFRRCSTFTASFSLAQIGDSYGIRPPVIGLSGLTGCAPPTAPVPGPSRGSR